MEAGVGVDGELFVGLEWKGFTGGVIAGLKSVRLDVNCPAASLPVTQIRELLVGGELPKRCPGIGLRLHDWQGNGLGVQQIVVRLEVDFGPAPTSIAPGYTDWISSPSSNNVKFVFAPSGLSLYGNVQSLSKGSPYFKTLFESGFAEGSPSTPEQGASKSNQRKVEREYDDSDDETDDCTLSSNADSDSVASTPANDLSFRIVNIDAAAYTTYRAVLCWLQTGHIAFAPLRSSFRLQPDPSALRNAKVIIPQHDFSHPFPASPKSVYRLAHFLELPKLAKLALDNLKSQLAKENVAFEVFGDVASIYEEVRKVEMACAVEHWEFVIGSPAMVAVGRLVDEGELPSFGPTSLRILRTLAERAPVW